MSELFFDQEEHDRQEQIGFEIGRAKVHDEEFKRGYASGFPEGKQLGTEAGLAEGNAEGARAFRERCRSIMTAPEAKGREATARHLALETDLGVEECLLVLRSTASSSSIEARAAQTVVFRQ